MKSSDIRVRPVVVAVVAALALLAAACGGSDAVEPQAVEAAAQAPQIDDAGEAAADSPPIAFATDDEAADDQDAEDQDAAAPVNDAAAFGGASIPEVDEVVVTGDALVGFDGAAASDPAVGVASPVFEARNLADGERITLPAGGPIIVGFFAHWCPHCQAELPVLVDWLGSGALPDDVTFVAVSTAVSDERPNYPPSAWFNNEGWSGLAVADDAQASLLATHGFSGFPAFIAIDADGIVVDRVGGNVGVAGFDRLAASLAG